jgi:signal transduction histidine kinase
MKTPFRENRISTLIVIPSAIIVAALAILQYRWSTRISEATAIRLADSLQMSMINWQKDFFRYFSEIGLALRIDPLEDAPGDLNQYARRFAEWQAVAKYPRLVSGVYLLKSGPAAQQSDSHEQPAALRLNPDTRRFEPAQWPAAFEPLRGELTRASAEFVRGTASPEPHELFDMAGWRFNAEAPALVHPFVLGSAASKPLSLQAVTWIAIELNRQEIESRILADLSRNYFQGTDGLDYLIAVVSGTKPVRVLYSSDAGFGDPLPADADGTIDLFGRAGSPVHVFHVPSSDKGPDPSVRISWFPFLHEADSDLDWRLVVRHRRGGPLGAFVGEMRRRDLAIGFGVLLVLVINMAMLIVTSHRAQRLAQMQMDFVTAVSHELRTPLTVILSGADNICNGVVESGRQMKQYGAVIANQARQLFALVEQILMFAATRQGGGLRYSLRPLQVQDAIDAALASTAGLIAGGQCTVECEIAEGLPQIAGDAPAVSQCLQNLITNAVKYGNGGSHDQRWIGIRAGVHEGAVKEVQISVSDRGIGISDVDLPHIFEPFYRSPAVKSAQIHGTGLGLPLSRSIAEALKGRLEVTSALGRGSTFTLYIPCA